MSKVRSARGSDLIKHHSEHLKKLEVSTFLSQALSWFGYKMTLNCSCLKLGSQLVALFWKVMKQ